MNKKKLFLLDGHALCYRAFFAIKGLSTSHGRATNAILGMVNTLNKILRDYQPEYMAICFDSKEKTNRAKKFAEYKIQRPSMPADLRDQIPIIKDIIKAYNIATFEVGGFEADDIIATLSKWAVSKGIEVVIVSEDKDLYQIIDKNILFFSPKKEKMLDSQDIAKLLGFPPNKITDFIALAGDSSDNIPGIRGIGETTAKKLLLEFGDIESIFDNLDRINVPRLRQALQENRDIAFLSKELAILDTNVPIECNLEKLKIGLPDKQTLFNLFKQLEFKKMAEEFSSSNHNKQINTVRILTLDEVKKLISNIKKSGEFAYLVIGLDKNKKDDDAILFNNSNSKNKAHIIISIGEDDKIYWVPASFFNAFKKIFENNKILKITYDIKTSLKILKSYGCILKGRIFDVMLAGYLLRPMHASSKIDNMAWEYLNESIESNKTDDSLSYKCDIVYRLKPKLQDELEKKELMKLFREIEIPLSFVLFKMEEYGVKLNIHILTELSKKCDEKIKQLQTKLFKMAGTEFNLNSPKQLSHILFDKLRLPVIKRTKTGASTNEEVLSKLAQINELPAMILEYRQITKLKSTYIDALPKMVNRATGRIHACFDQTGTETGRLSSRDPNLQNIPVRTELGKQIRKAFVPSREGMLMLAADYSQIELRILAHLSKDENLTKAFKNGEDIHSYTASLIFDTSINNLTTQMRNAAKKVNFGIIYGMSAFGLAKDLHISQTEAQEFINKYFLRYPRVKEFMEESIRLCEDKGFVVTLLNRRRYLPEINSNNNSLRQFAQRQAINTRVQGSAADLIKLAMINIQKTLEANKMSTRMLMTIHDELVFESPLDEKAKTLNIVRDKMENALTLSVPIKVVIKTGNNWLEMREEK